MQAACLVMLAVLKHGNNMAEACQHRAVKKNWISKYSSNLKIKIHIRMQKRGIRF